MNVEEHQLALSQCTVVCWLIFQILLSPLNTEIGMKFIVSVLYPTLYKYSETSFLIYLYLVSSYSVASNLLRATTIWLTPMWETIRAYSLVCPSFEIPDSNSIFLMQWWGWQDQHVKFQLSCTYWSLCVQGSGWYI